MTPGAAHGLSAGRMVGARLLGSVAAIFGVSIISFAFLRMLPGDPARLILGPTASQASVDALIDQLGLNDSLVTQYLTYVTDFFSGDWGYSFTNGAPVADLFDQRLRASLELGMSAFVIAVVVSTATALIAVHWPGRATDRALQGFVYFGLGTPPFWLGLLVLILFFDVLGIFPGPEGQLSPDIAPPPDVTGFVTIDALLAGQFETFANAVWHLVLPATVLALVPAAYLTRLLYSSLQEVQGEPFLTTVRSKGVSRWRTQIGHAFPNALVPTLTAAGPVFAELLAGSVFVETVFNWPGIGQLTVQGILRQDYAIVETFILLTATAYVLLNLVIDAVVVAIDPRVRAPSAVR